MYDFKNISPVKISAALAALVIVFFAITLTLIYAFGLSSPAYSNGAVTVTIDSGQSIKGIANELKADGVVRSSVIAQSLMVFFGGERSVKAGIYVFEKPQNVFSVASRVAHGDFGYIPIKLTEPEGTNISKLAAIVADKFPHISATSFEEMASTSEGYLFPETYFFAPQSPAELIIKRMNDTFLNEIKPYNAEIGASGRSREDIIKMASILEAEVQTDTDRKMVADLLWRRLDAGMRLQVDSTLGYVLDKTSAELTLSDLKKDNPYNTYLHAGLPPTPISNPGLESILAALHPTPNPYLFYLSDKDGITHFSKTYEEHLKLQKQYLK